MQSPWYKQFWPWFLIALPGTAVIVSFTNLYIASSNAPDMVIDDYYKKGKAINLELAREKRAAELGIVLEAAFSDNNGGVQLLVTHQGTKPQQFGALKLHLYHPTLSERDYHLTLTSDAQGNYKADLPSSFSGKWRLTIESLTDDWRLQNYLDYPNQTKLTLAP
ncbi:FixH family protein [Corallincola platygyrae]|uniref:FixH family protein n=1 Tax=Corallincola platygyrae TaxID=1193278 RepID=A0ABW4XK89_9GAMM